MRLFAALLIASATLASPSLAQIAVGATVKDTAGGVVGTIASVSGGNAIVDTGRNKVTIPETSFGKTPEGPLLAMTREQLDTAVETANAEAKAKLTAAAVPGAEVRGSAGTVLGKIEKVEADAIVLASDKGSARLPLANLTLQADGLHFGMTAEEFAAAVEAARAGTGK